MNAHEVLADFLRTDVQDYRPRIDEITAVLARGGDAVFTGNAFELSLSSKQAILRHTHGRHPSVTLPTATFADAFHSWVAALPQD